MDDGEITLRLKYPPLPENASRLAAVVVTAARDVSGVKLDYSPRSLKDVEAILDSFRGDGVSTQEIADTLFSFGCYLGEVIVRRTRARWVPTADTKMRDFTPWPIVVLFSEEDACNPIGQAFKYFANGSPDSLAYFYTVFASKREGAGILQKMLRRFRPDA